MVRLESLEMAACSQPSGFRLPCPARGAGPGASPLLFTADGPQGLLIFNISNAKSPVLLSQLSLSSPVWDAASLGTTALLPADALGLVIVDP